jgi:hypothetical protein
MARSRAFTARVAQISPAGSGLRHFISLLFNRFMIRKFNF